MSAKFAFFIFANYSPGFYAEWYIVFVFPFVHLCVLITLVEFMSKFLVKVFG